MKFNQFADLHCHPHLRSFNWLRDTRYENNDKLNKKYFHPWFVVFSNLKAKEKGKRATSYSQSDLIKLANGHVKLAYLSLYPMEKGWFKKQKNFTEKIMSHRWPIISKNGILSFIADTISRNKKVPDTELKLTDQDKTTLRDFIQSIYMRLPKRRINFFQSNTYNYFNELNREKNFILKRNNILTKSDIYFPSFIKDLFTNKKEIEKNIEFNATGTYEIAANGDDIQRIISEGKIAFILTIEGANVFNTNEKDVNKIISRIEEVKNWKYKPNEDAEEIPLRVFSINFAHHFSNSLCGHCRSIPNIGRILIDQSDDLNLGFKDKGKLIVRYLLSLDLENNINPEYGRRILIDVKHMSARSRKYYYEEIVRPCGEKSDVIPVISSHSAYSGIETLGELISHSAHERDSDCYFTPDKPFNKWSINLCNEDIIEIFKSGGIIGINLDQKILAMPKKKKTNHYPEDYDIKFFWRNLKTMMDVVIDSTSDDLPPKNQVVNLFGLGSDFDGYIDPLDKYPSSLEYNKLAEDLYNEINKDIQKDKYLFGLSSEQFVKRIVFENALEFAVRNFK